MSAEVWSYDSPGVVKMTGDFTTNYPINTKVIVVQTTQKYFVVTDSQLVTGETKLTLDGQGKFTLANAVITSHLATSWSNPTSGFPLSDPAYSASDHTHPAGGDVTGPASAVDGNLAAFDEATGKLIKDSQYPMAILASLAGGWMPADETWTYASADAPTFMFTVAGDVRTKYYPGMKVKYTQTTIKFGIVTVVSYTSPNSTITIYGGTDFVMTGDAITLPHYSMMHSPAGFPRDVSKWQVTTTDTSTRSKETTGANTTYYSDWGSKNISVPIGLWRFKVQVSIDVWDSDSAEVVVAMSTANNSVSSKSLAAFVGNYDGADIVSFVHIESMVPVAVAAKTPYYFVIKTITACDGVSLFNDESTFVMLAECAYL